MNKKTLFLSIGGILLVSLITIGLTYAYWVASIEGTGEVISLKIANLKVILTDTEILSSEAVEPGWSDSKEFTVENEGNTTREYNIVIKNLVNTLVTEESLLYKITSDTGYNMTEYAAVPKSSETREVVLAYSVPIEGKTTHTYTIEFTYVNLENVDQSEDMGKEFSGNISITEGSLDPNKTLYNQILADNPTILTRTDFSTVFTDDNTGTLYTVDGNFTEDIDGDNIGETVYYYAGNALNNWVKFGQDSTGSDLYWRIIRTNEDGSVRLIYVGTAIDTETGYVGDVYYNNSNDNAMYVGYMYGTTGSLANNRTNENDSTIKGVIDNWYEGSINVQTDGTYTYDYYVSKTAIYCNDRATSSYASRGEMSYAASDRLGTNKQPSYKCGVQNTGSLYSTADSADKFSVNTSSGGNGKLIYPVALMTADEIVYAGGTYGNNAAIWYYYNSVNSSVIGGLAFWWTMTPYSINSNVVSLLYAVHGSVKPGMLSYTTINTSPAVIRPSLSLKSCITYKSGNGSSSNPYEVTLSETCSTLEN